MAALLCIGHYGYYFKHKMTHLPVLGEGVDFRQSLALLLGKTVQQDRKQERTCWCNLQWFCF